MVHWNKAEKLYYTILYYTNTITLLYLNYTILHYILQLVTTFKLLCNSQHTAVVTTYVLDKPAENR